ncbi:hypothetical protein ACFL6C_02140 [Myxococcota bacterium]
MVSYQVLNYLGIARSTLYRWLHNIDDVCPAPSAPHNRTPNVVAQLVWDIARANLGWGRVRIANQLGLLGVFLAASTVKNILSRPKCRDQPEAVPHNAKVVPLEMERRYFAEARVTGFRLPRAA